MPVCPVKEVHPQAINEAEGNILLCRGICIFAKRTPYFSDLVKANPFKDLYFPDPKSGKRPTAACKIFNTIDFMLGGFIYEFSDVYAN